MRGYVEITAFHERVDDGIKTDIKLTFKQKLKILFSRGVSVCFFKKVEFRTFYDLDLLKQAAADYQITRRNLFPEDQRRVTLSGVITYKKQEENK